MDGSVYIPTCGAPMLPTLVRSSLTARHLRLRGIQCKLKCWHATAACVLLPIPRKHLSTSSDGGGIAIALAYSLRPLRRSAPIRLPKISSPGLAFPIVKEGGARRRRSLG